LDNHSGSGSENKSKYQMSDDGIRIEKSFNATVEKVWAAWTEPQLLLKWFGSDPDGKGIKATMNVQAGGSYKITFQDSNGTQHTCLGKYLIVEKFKQLSFTWEWKNEPGVESLVIMTLIPENSNALMTFEHRNVGTASAHNYLTGWKATFLKLERIVGEMTFPQ
jgi:uncharacterized protein YndB with AHSA1/START domain